MNLLRLNNFKVAYGGIKAVKGVSLSVDFGEVVALIGSNGAGKTSLLKAICGLVDYQGQIEFKGENINKLRCDQLAKLGLSMVPEGRGVFTRLTVEENLLMGAFLVNDKKDIAKNKENMFRMFPRLEERRAQIAGTLSGGEQQMLAIGRSLMGRPDLLLLDEPSMGLAPLMVEKIFEVINQISSSKVTILLVEQNAKLALEYASRGYVMNNGEITLEGPSGILLNDSSVRKAYLGE
ncbi:MAG: ABC transporter ATP-binding protein [Proteobacteria bacterium]|nr:ABC transporter ATP-binding protein [Pseudomonadota bacterium]